MKSLTSEARVWMHSISISMSIRLCFPKGGHNSISQPTWYYRSFYNLDLPRPPSRNGGHFSPYWICPLWQLQPTERTDGWSNVLWLLRQSHNVPCASIWSSVDTCSGNPATVLWGSPSSWHRANRGPCWPAGDQHPALEAIGENRSPAPGWAVHLVPHRAGSRHSYRSLTKT